MQRTSSTILSKKLLRLTLGGGLVFWATTIATSLLPIAAEYRAAFSNWKIQTVWVDSLFAGLIIGCGVSFFLMRSLDKLPTKHPILESAKISSIVLVIATILIDVPRSLLAPEPSNTWYYFAVGLMFNATRFLFLGFIIGYLYKRLHAAA